MPWDVNNKTMSFFSHKNNFLVRALIGSGTFRAGGRGLPKSGTNRENFQGSSYIPLRIHSTYTIKNSADFCHCMHLAVFFLDPLGFLLYPGFTESAKSGPHRPRPVFINVRGPKEILVLAKGHLGDPKDIFGTCKSAEDLEKISWRSEMPWESKKKCFVVSNGHGATKRDLGEIRKSRDVPKEILKTFGT